LDTFKYQLVDILSSMIESKLTLFKMQVKYTGGACLGIEISAFWHTPETFYFVCLITVLANLFSL